MENFEKNLRDEFYNRLNFLVQQYTDDEECFGDGAQIRINTETLDIELIDDPDENLDGYDYYDVIDLLIPKTDGTFKPDLEKINEIADEMAG